jgi:UDP-3-O-[3-hydroxymyristoyl] glucosamine N-acyltransferase
MSFTLGEITRLVRGTCHGDPGLIIDNADIIRDAQAGSITLADKAELLESLSDSEAVAVIVPQGISVQDRSYVEVDDVHVAFARVVNLFYPRESEGQTGISSTAEVHPTAEIGEGVTIFPHVYVGPNVKLGDHVTLHPGVSIMAGCTIGSHTTIYPNSVLYELTEVGNHCMIHANATLGAFGFGYDSSTGRHVLSAQSGFVRLEDHVDIGAGTTIDRGTYGPTIIGEGSKLDNQVMVAHNCRIGKHNLLCSQVGIAGSCTTGDYVVMAGQVGIGDHLEIGSKTILGAKAGVMADIPGDSIFVGIPATPHREQMQKQAALAKLPEMRKQFKKLQKELSDVIAQVQTPPKSEAA